VPRLRLYALVPAPVRHAVLSVELPPVAIMHPMASTGEPVVATTEPLTFRHWAGDSPYVFSFDVAETCVFDHTQPVFAVQPVTAPATEPVVGGFE